MNDRPEVPVSDALRLDEAVELLVAKGLRDADIRAAIERALIEARLREMQWVAMTAAEVATLHRIEMETAAHLAAKPTAVRSLLDEMFPAMSEENVAAADVAVAQLISDAVTPDRLSSLEWQDIIRAGRIDWPTGIVACRSSRFTPVFSRSEVLELFNIRPPAPRPPGGKEVFAKLLNWYLTEWIPSWSADHIPNRNEDTAAGKAALDWVTRDLIDEVRRDPRVKPFLRPRGHPKKLPNI